MFVSVDCVPNSRDVLGPLSVEGFCPFLKLIQFILDHFHSFTISTFLCHGLQTKREKEMKR